ncbi:MAG: hypothetical protein ACP5QS_02765 [bacterium]
MSAYTIPRTLKSVVSDDEALRRLLFREKEKRRATKGSLVFVNAKNIAISRWCEWESLFRSYEEEGWAFWRYIWNKTVNAYRWGKIERFPKDAESALNLIRNLELKKEDINKILEGMDRQRIRSYWEEDETAFWFDPSREFYECFTREFTPLYPSFGWGFDFEGLVIVAHPTGISENFVYINRIATFKDELFYHKITASLEGDICGYFFGKEKKRLEVIVQEEQKCFNWEGKVDAERAIKALLSFKDFAQRLNVSLPPSWKCAKCPSSEDCEMKKYCI